MLAEGDDVAGKKEELGWMPTASERKKLIPLGIMLFFILFNYTILRDTKDVLVVTAPKSGAEIIPFLKTYVQLPGAVAFTVMYSKISNRMNQEQAFYLIVGVFLSFFAAFGFVLYPMINVLHPHAAADALMRYLPASFAGPISIFRNWTFALFYLMATLWGSTVVSLLFWGLANRIMSVAEAKRYYPFFGLGANVALIFSGAYVRYVSGIRGSLAPGVDPWGVSLKLLMGAFVCGGAVVLAMMRRIETNVLNDPNCVDAASLRKAKKKTTMGMAESAKYLANSAYIRNMALLVIGYGMSINIIEVTWKACLKEQFPDSNAYSMFMGAFSQCTGVATLLMMLLSRLVFAKFGWGVAAQITPVTILIIGIMFFSLVITPGLWTPVAAAVGCTPLMLSVLLGAAQNIFSKSAKYAFFDPCKEMAYIPLDAEEKSKGKAAVDVIGNPMGKSGGSLVQQAAIIATGSLSAAAPFLGGVLVVVVVGWVY